MVEIKYRGRFGNHIFQYCFGRILAEGLGYKLKATSIPGFPNTEELVEGSDYSLGFPVQIVAHDYPQFDDIEDYKNALSWKNRNLNMKSLLMDKTKRKIVIFGYFERYEYYKNYKNIIRNNWLKTEPWNGKNKIHSDDVVIHIRRGDMVKLERCLPYSYYAEALEKVKYRLIYIVTDDPRDPFMKYFKRFKYHIYHSTALDDFRFIMSFNKIIASASSFSWWASFLSRASEIYMPTPLNGHWSQEHEETNLVVDDEDRYIYIKCKEPYLITNQDKRYWDQNARIIHIKHELKKMINLPRELARFLFSLKK